MKLYIIFITVLFSVNLHAQYTAIPDQYFEYFLIQEGLDDVQDGQVLTANINQVTELDLSGFIITDITGIQDFTLLTSLNCSENEITFIDLSANTQLQFLDCTGNQLNLLTMGNNSQLEEVWASENNLTSINTSGLSNLTYFLVDGNQLTSLNFSNNPSLRQLWCDSNNLNELDLSTQSNLNELYSGDNPNLSFINVKNGNNAEMEEFNAIDIQQNACIQVDDEVAATNGTTYPYKDWGKDESAQYSENCSLELETFLINKIKIYPNPTHEKVNIQFLNENQQTIIKVIDITGKTIMTTTGDQLDLSKFPKGMYLVNITLENGSSITQKVIKD